MMTNEWPDAAPVGRLWSSIMGLQPAIGSNNGSPQQTNSTASPTNATTTSTSLPPNPLAFMDRFVALSQFGNNDWSSMMMPTSGNDSVNLCKQTNHRLLLLLLPAFSLRLLAHALLIPYISLHIFHYTHHNLCV
jgi:hypothetical protein